MSEPFTPDYWKEMYECVGKSHESWLISAKSLKASADIIWNNIGHTLYDADGAKISHNTAESEVEAVYLMLLGMSVENAIKAICIIHNQELISSGKLKPWGCDGHNLVDIAKLAKLSCDERLLKILSYYIKWAGRYPMPTKYSTDPINEYPVALLPFEKENIDQLVKSIFIKVEEEAMKVSSNKYSE